MRGVASRDAGLRNKQIGNFITVKISSARRKDTDPAAWRSYNNGPLKRAVTTAGQNDYASIWATVYRAFRTAASHYDVGFSIAVEVCYDDRRILPAAYWVGLSNYKVSGAVIQEHKHAVHV